MENIRKRTIYVTLDDERDDLSILHQYGRTYLRQVTIQRITEEAIEQDGLLTQEDLSRLLRCSKRTIRRDIRAIQDRGVHVVTRGVFHNVGRCQTHKSQIIRLYLEGFTYSEIHRKCYHTTSSNQALPGRFQEGADEPPPWCYGLPKYRAGNRIIGLSVSSSIGR